jgi:hypothetical protein
VRALGRVDRHAVADRGDHRVAAGVAVHGRVGPCAGLGVAPAAVGVPVAVAARRLGGAAGGRLPTALGARALGRFGLRATVGV